jgi:HD-like signal output (HDOD) protein
MAQALSGNTMKSIPEWTDFLKKTNVPVLKHTAREIARLQEDEDKLSARSISNVVLNDPMMVFRVLSYAQQHKSRHQTQDLVQVEQAIIMMGTTAFFKNVPPNVLVENLLGSQLKALTHLLKLIKRAHRAAYYATEWAVYHMDLHAEEIRIAALLHDLSEMLMWCFAPEKMIEIVDMQHANKSFRSALVQEVVLGFKLRDLQHALVEHFKLPPLLSKLMDDDSFNEQRVKNVVLAVNFARHSANGWDDAALPDDYKDIAAFLRVDKERVMRILGAPEQ